MIQGIIDFFTNPDTARMFLSIIGGMLIADKILIQHRIPQAVRRIMNMEEFKDVRGLSEDLRKVTDFVNDYHKFSNSEESEILAHKVAKIVERTDKITKGLVNNPLIMPNGGGSDGKRQERNS